ncbi:MAG: protoporphyrinogen oxidase HemJ [Pseudolabrys sp.]|nr:protoporphyrinogen oxidase HemJ [Pseudolabrys sp.]
MYLTLKALHIIAVISWMAGMLYLPRLFVYHAAAAKGSEQSETFKVMEHRLLRYIMTPAMAVTWVLGLWLVWETGAHAFGWFYAKLALVLGMSAMHGKLAAWTAEFGRDANVRPAKFYRMINEVPTVLMVLIVLLAVIKPF